MYILFQELDELHWLYTLLSGNSGDQDSVIPLTGSRKLVHGLAEELGLSTSTPYRVWFAGMQVIPCFEENIKHLA